MDQNRQQQLRKLTEFFIAHRTSAEINLFKELITLRLQDSKDKLTTAALDTVQGLQGEVRAYNQLLKDIQRQSIQELQRRKDDE